MAAPSWVALSCFALLAVAAVDGTPAHAQSQMGYGDVGADDDTVTAGSGKSAKDGKDKDSGDGPGRKVGKGGHRHVHFQPYAEVSQTFLAELTPGNARDMFTTPSIGAELTVQELRTLGTVSIRYSRRYVEMGNNSDSSMWSGMARLHQEIVPHTLGIEIGGLAATTAVTTGGMSSLNTISTADSISQIWSGYVGPAFTTSAGPVAIKTSYTLGYSSVGAPHSVISQPNDVAVGLFSHSVSQQANASAGIRPGDVLPVGLRASGSWVQEDVSTLDQRLDDMTAMLRMTIPLTRSFALVAEAGWERVQVSQRDALLNAAGQPEVLPNGQYIADTTRPRQIAYDTDGLIWDGGVMWRPSKRTSLEAFVGRRYDGMTYYGTFNHAPTPRSNLSFRVYDGISGFGSSMNDAVRQLPTDFEVVRDPFSGDIGGCAVGAAGGGCVNGVLGSISSSIFRGRGASLTYGSKVGLMQASFSVGYTNRRFIAAADSVLASVNGTIDETWYVNAGLFGPIDRHSTFGVSVFGGLSHQDGTSADDARTWGASGSVSRKLTEHLTGSGSVGFSAVDRPLSPQEIDMLASLALRYNF